MIEYEEPFVGAVLDICEEGGGHGASSEPLKRSRLKFRGSILELGLVTEREARGHYKFLNDCLWKAFNEGKGSQ